jgi:outer membrane protein OmpA-like peptidoglycan-associated protein/uncharacterized protein YidB (DUF937 family)
MFDSLIKEIATRFHLNEERALPLVQLVLAYMTNKETGGLTGFVQKFKNAGLGGVVQSWIGGNPAHAQEISEGQVQQVLGGPAGLLRLLTSKFGINSQVGSTMLGFLMPRLMGTLTPQGTLQSVVPHEITDFIGEAKSWLMGTVGGTIAYSSDAKTDAAKPAGKSLMKWLPLLLLAGAAIFLLSYCTKKPVVVESTSNVAAAAKESSGAAATTDAFAFPTGAGVLLAMIDGTPSLKVYFDTGKEGISPEFAERAKPLADYLKAHSDIKAAISGYNDATGDPAVNAELSKKRAQAVADALKALGAPESSLVLEKPLNPVGTGDTNAESRRVEVILRK